MKQIYPGVYSLLTMKKLMLTVIVMSLYAFSSTNASNYLQNPVLDKVVSSDRVIKSDQLKRINPTNLWGALQLLEPLLIGNANSEFGSDPNVMLSKDYSTLRGAGEWRATSTKWLSFYLDGAEISAERMLEIDIDNVASVTIVKDPRSLTLLGIKGANGAIAITTTAVVKGVLRVNYKGDFSLNKADLSSYDLMSGTEKLDFENRLGLYESKPELLQQLLKEGNNINYLQQALRTSFSHRHRLEIEGGDDNVRYRLTGRLNPDNGVMKNTDCNTKGISAYIDYRRDRLFVSNELVYNNIKGSMPSTADFYSFTTANSYDNYRYENGKLKPYLGDDLMNPVYEISLGSFNKSTINFFSERLNLSYDLGKGFEISGQGIYMMSKRQGDLFISPQSIVFVSESDDSDSKGLYSIARVNTTSLEANLKLSYNKQIEKSTFGADLRGNIYSKEMLYDKFEGFGIPSDKLGYISFSKHYGGSPDAGKEYDRTLSGDVSLYYDYDDRYSIAASLHMDHSSLLAKQKRTATFYGLSANWNISNEVFLKDSKLVELLRLGVSTGTSGMVDFTDDYTTLKYADNIGNNYIYDYFLASSNIPYMFNNRLKWRTTKNSAVWVDGKIEKLTFRLEYYYNVNTDILTHGDVLYATGYSFYASNGGKIKNSGFEYQLNYDFMDDQPLRLSLFTSGATNKNEIVSLPPSLNGSYLQKGSAVNMLYDNIRGRVNVDPKLRGNVGVNVAFKRLFATVAGNFSVGGYIPNETLRRSDSPVLNQTRAAAKYIAAKGEISMIEKNNWISLGTVQVGWKFDSNLLRKYYIKGLSAYFTANDLWYHRSANIERGVFYPCARRYTLSLNVQF